MKRTAWFVGLSALFIGCFSTPQPNCAFRCGMDNECPSGYACGPSDSICHLVVNETLADCEVTTIPDGPAQPDAPNVGSFDAPPSRPDSPIAVVPDSPISMPDAPPPSTPDAPPPSTPDAPPPSTPDAPPPSTPDAPVDSIDAGT